jgi:hypothetical protein
MFGVNTDKAKEIAKDKIRAWREEEFKKNDVKLQNAIADEDSVAKAEAIARRDELRDKPAIIDTKTTVDEITAVLQEENLHETAPPDLIEKLQSDSQ